MKMRTRLVLLCAEEPLLVDLQLRDCLVLQEEVTRILRFGLALMFLHCFYTAICGIVGCVCVCRALSVSAKLQRQS